MSDLNIASHPSVNKSAAVPSNELTARTVCHDSIVATTSLKTAGRDAVQADAASSTASQMTPPGDDRQEVVTVIKQKAARLCQAHPFTISDFDDLVQELTWTWEQQCVRFDHTEGSLRTFRKTVLERKAAQMLARSRAAKRYCPTLESLCQLPMPGDSRQCIDPDRDRRRDGGGGSKSRPERQTDLRMDVGELIAGLPPQLRSLCDMLMYRSQAEISDDLKVPPSTLSSRLSSIRRCFANRKLSEFL